MPSLRDWLFAVGVGCAAGVTYWVLYPLPGLIWRAIVPDLPFASEEFPMSADFTVYSEGFCFASVCTSLANDEATARMPWSGTSHGWQIADEPFADGTPNGAPCPDEPTTHRHLLFEC